MLGPEDHVPCSDFQDGWGLDGRGDGEESELMWRTILVVTQPMALTVEELQPTLDVQRLEGRIRLHVSKSVTLIGGYLRHHSEQIIREGRQSLIPEFLFSLFSPYLSSTHWVHCFSL